MKVLRTPIDPRSVEELRVEETFRVSGKLFTARDAAHEKLLGLAETGGEPPLDLSAYPCYHSGPVMEEEDGTWKVVSAGPTTSSRLEIFESDFMDRFGTRVFIGKGGMGARTSEALKEHGGVYAQFTGGAGSLVAEAVTEVLDVHYLEELGIPEAVWEFEVAEFGPLLVTMDSTGSSIHRDLSRRVEDNLSDELELL